MNVSDTLKERLKATRKKRGLQQDELAAMLGISRAGYSAYETGATFPPADKLTLLADILKVSTDYLLGRTDEPYEMFSNTDLSKEETRLMRKFLMDAEMTLREADSVDEVKLGHVKEFLEFVFKKNQQK